MSYFRKFLYPSILIFLTVLICFLNYKSNTFLTGWDTLHPEFNFNLNFKRLFFGVWHQEQGLGAIPGHSQMADLPRVLILWIFHFFLPLNFLRYSYIFLCFILGPLGIYFLISLILKNKNIAFLSSLFYIFNLSTLQQFYVPFEMFPTQWAFLPWIILFAIKNLQKPSKSNLINFLVFSLLSTPQAYAAHLWYPFFGIFSLFLFIYWLLHKNKKTFKTASILIALTLFINSFWLLPNLYFIFTSSSVVENSKVNRLFSQEYLLQNRETGYIKDVALQKGFYFNWQIYNSSTSKFENLMPQWNNYLNQPIVTFIGYLLFFLCAIGLIFSFFNKNPLFISISPFIIIPFILLTNNIFPFDKVFDFLIKFSIFEQAFRFIFTKFSILFLFGLTLYFSYFLHTIFNLFLKKPIQIFISLFFIISFLIYTFPFFTGQLISKKMEINIPLPYFQLYGFLKNKPEGKILSLPLYNFTGWQYYNWGYQGSGFIWFNLKQSILDRDFDRWSSQNEEAFREFFFTLYAKNPDSFLQTITKYNIKYILWDQNIITPSEKNREQIVFINEINSILSQLQEQKIISSPKQFGNIYLYEILSNSSLIKISDIKNNISPTYLWNFWDNAFFTYHDYLTSNKNFSDVNKINFPLRDLINNREKINYEKLKNLKLIDEDNQIKFEARNILFTDSQTNFLKLKDFDNQKIIDYQTTNTSTGSNLETDIPHNKGFIIGFKSRFFQGLPLRFCVQNQYNNICTVYEELGKHKNFDWDYYLLPPMDNFSGFAITLDNISLGNYTSHNQLAEIALIPLIADISPKINSNQSSETILDYKNFSFFYQINLSGKNNKNTLVFNQSFHQGWLAFYFDGLRPIFLKDHVLVNNWANGWFLPNTKYLISNTIYLIFWPQVLEFLGFGLLIGTIILILKFKDK